MGLFKKRQTSDPVWKLPPIELYGDKVNHRESNEDKELTNEVTELFAKYGCEAEKLGWKWIRK
jgi:hypothetical protein